MACREFFLFALQISALVFLRTVGASWDAWCDCVTSLGPILLLYIPSVPMVPLQQMNCTHMPQMHCNTFK